MSVSNIRRNNSETCDDISGEIKNNNKSAVTSNGDGSGIGEGVDHGSCIINGKDHSSSITIAGNDSNCIINEKDDSSNKDGGGPWVRALSSTEADFEMSQAKHQHQITCYRLGLCSNKPLCPHTLHRTLSALYKKVPLLRLCIQTKDGGELWFREQRQEILHFKVLDGVDVTEEVERQITTSFASSTGPLWRATFIPFQDTEQSLMDESYPADFQHQYHLLLTFHHAITDGFTTVKVCNLLLELLNDEIEGKPIDVQKQLGVFSDGSETQRLMNKRRDQLEKDKKRKEMIVRAIGKISDFRPLMVEAFPVPEEEKRNTTLHLNRRLTKLDTKKLLTFFREEGISFNSGFIALANVSLVDMFKKRGCNQKTYEICSYNAVNLRRYWRLSSCNDLGSHSGPITLITDTPDNSNQNFLEYAHDIQTNMHDYIANNRTFDERLYLDLKKNMPYRNMDEFFTNPPKYPQFFYSTINLGNLSETLSGEGDHVQISWLSRHNSVHRYNSTIINSLQTFRDRFLLTVDYNANNVTTAVANEYADTIMKLIDDIVRQVS